MAGINVGGMMGGARPGAGRPKGSKNKPKDVLPPDFDPFADSIAPRTDYNTARASTEKVKALTGELNYRIKLGQYVERDKVRAASATAMSAFAQAMRSMPDDLERKLDLAPEVIEKISEYIDTRLDQLADLLEMFGGTKDDAALN